MSIYQGKRTYNKYPYSHNQLSADNPFRYMGTSFNPYLPKVSNPPEKYEFNQDEKKELLSILIKYLMPLANPEMDLSAYNESKTYFNTNLSITKLKRVKNKNYLKDELLKKAFVNKANRYHQDIMTGKNLIFNSSKNDILDI